MDWYFIRHGEIASNLKKVYSGRSDEELTQAGRMQVKAACQELVDLDINGIFCSPLVRTRQTAEIILDELGLEIPVHIDESFNELKMGPWEGMAESEVEKQYPEAWALWNRSPADLALNGRETLQQLQSRVLQGIRRIEDEYQYEAVLVVSHVAIIRVISLYATREHINKYKSVKVDNAKVTRFEIKRD